MSNNLRSEYIIELELEDKSKDAIRSIESQLSKIGKTAKDALKGGDMAESLKQAQKAASDMIDELGRLSKDSSIDFDAVIKSYSRNSKKAIGELETQYAVLKQNLSEITKQEKELNELTESGADISKRIEAATKLTKLYEQNKISSTKELETRIRQNREIRASLKAAEEEARAKAKYNKLEDLQAKRKATTDKSEKKALDDKIKQQKAYIKAIEQAEKATKANGKAVQEVVVRTTKLQKLMMSGSVISGALQGVYNTTGLIGGANRLVSGGLRMASHGLNMVSQSSDKALEREQAANRVKGMNSEIASKMIGDIYVKTGADTAAIVEAINRVRGVLKSSDPSEIAQAAALEIRYPGMALAFASSETGANLNTMNAYANRMRAVQKASGASAEQIESSAQKMANYNKHGAFDNTTITEMQAIYLGLQNSGAFESQDELDKAFDRFVRDRRGSDNAAWKDAQNYDWTKTMRKSHDKLQIANTLQSNMDWNAIRLATNVRDMSSPEQSTAEKNAERARKLEERKNEMMIKLIDIVEPIVNTLSKSLNSDKLTKIANGLAKFLTDVVPVIADILLAIAEKVGFVVGKIGDAVEQLQNGDRVEKDGKVYEVVQYGLPAIPKRANGGIALGPSLVGERGPEAIIPLDYSRAQRAENIAYSIQNNFTMSGNQTTALSLAQAVSSRDFSRAMSKAAFKAGRMGVF